MKPIEFKEMTTATNQKIDPEIQKKKCGNTPPLIGFAYYPLW